MTVLPILPIDHPLLRKQARPVVRFGPALRCLVDDLFATLQASEGAGLAAPQVGKGIQLFVADFRDERLALCNPVITLKEGETIGAEGCLSLPGFVGLRIRRAERIEVEGQDTYGNRISLSTEGIFARILQHEIDHLQGILFLDHLANPVDLRPILDEPPEETGAAEALVAADADH